jgi:hypothetical protein
VLFRFVRPFLPILYAAVLLGGWSSAIYAQSDTRNQQNRQTLRDSRSTQSANPAVMAKEMQATLQKLPWNELSPAAQTKIKSIVSQSPLFHRMPQQKNYADSEIHQFLLQHPDLVIGFWEQLGATQLSLREVKENHYVLQETGGTVAAIEILYRTDNLCIAYAKGEYRGPLLAKAYQGDVLLVLRTQYTRDETNDPVIVSDLDTFIQINSLGADMLVKLFFASLAKIADSNFEVTMSFVSQVSGAASRSPNSIKDAAEEVTSIRQDVCVDFCDVVDRVAMRFARRNQPVFSPIARQRTQPVAVQPRGDLQNFALSSRPPADWGMDHVFDASQFDVSLPFGEPIGGESTGELSVPRRIESERTGTAPKLPGPVW